MAKAVDCFLDKCRVLFQEADKDGNGLQPGEMKALVRKLAPNCSDRQIAEMFVDIDKDGDMTITWKEFETEMKKKNPKAIGEKELTDTFKKLDADGSGKLDPAEIAQCYKNLGMTDSTSEDVEKLISKADKDGDGKVSYQEFLAAWRQSAGN